MIDDKYKANLETIQSFISEVAIAKSRYRKPMLEIPNLPDVKAIYSLLSPEEYWFFLYGISERLIDNSKHVSERFIVKIQLSDFKIRKNTFYAMLNRLCELKMLRKHSRGEYLINPAFVHKGLTSYEKYSLGFMSEEEYRSKLNFAIKNSQT